MTRDSQSSPIWWRPTSIRSVILPNYSDDTTPSVTQCTGDDYEYATSGVWINQAVPNTDPYLGAFNVLTSRRVVYYEAPGQTVTTASGRSQQALTPLELDVQPY